MIDCLPRLGFTECNYVAAFQEHELELLAASDAAQRIVNDAASFAALTRPQPKPN